jgi:hypothetical protein
MQLAVRAWDVASIEIDSDRTVCCCERGVHFMLAYRLYGWKKVVQVARTEIAARLEEMRIAAASD